MDSTQVGFSRIVFSLGNDIVTEKRARYTLWDLFGDAGGFNESMIYVCHFLTYLYA